MPGLANRAQWHPPTNEEQEKALGNFFQTTGAPPTTAKKIPGVLKEIEKQYPDINTWGIVGFCWGGKIVSLTSGSETPFKAAAECHPASTSDLNPLFTSITFRSEKNG